MINGLRSEPSLVTNLRMSPSPQTTTLTSAGGRVDPVNNLLAGGCGGLLSLTVGHPFDTVKVRLQTMQPVHCIYTGVYRLPYSGGLDCCRQLVRNHGVTSLYRGMGALAIFSLPRFSLMFYANSWGRILGKELESNLSKSSTKQKATGKKSSAEFSNTQILFGGIFSQLIVCPLIVNPLERAKVLLQSSHKLNGQLDCFKYILQREGIQGLFRGTSLTLGRDIPSFCTYFLVYENFRSRLKESGMERIPMWATAFIGGISGMCGWAVAIPVDNLKNRHQVSMGNGNIFTTLTTILQEGGIKQLYRGGTVVLVRAFPANAATFVGYEFTIQLIEASR